MRTAAQPSLQTSESSRSGGKFCLVTLGCPKNMVDSERMAGLLGLGGYKMVREPEGSDFVVINTCASSVIPAQSPMPSSAR